MRFLFRIIHRIFVGERVLFLSLFGHVFSIGGFGGCIFHGSFRISAGDGFHRGGGGIPDKHRFHSLQRHHFCNGYIIDCVALHIGCQCLS